MIATLGTPSGRPTRSIRSVISRDRRRGAVAAAWHVLIGRPLRADESSSNEISSVEGLPALSLDALTSVAYGPEAIIVVLALAGAGALHLVLQVTIAIVVLLVILITSYRQVIDAYPSGGGAYAVSRANLFRVPASWRPPPSSSTTRSRSPCRSPPAWAPSRRRSRASPP